jgi:hypothetical protein
MHLPKKLIVVGKSINIRYDPKRSDGETDLDTGDMIIGTENPANTYGVLLHEIFELSLHRLGHRYSRYNEGNAGLRFVMNHSGFETFVESIELAIKEISK